MTERQYVVISRYITGRIAPAWVGPRHRIKVRIWVSCAPSSGIITPSKAVTFYETVVWPATSNMGSGNAHRMGPAAVFFDGHVQWFQVTMRMATSAPTLCVGVGTADTTLEPGDLYVRRLTAQE